MFFAGKIDRLCMEKVGRMRDALAFYERGAVFKYCPPK